MEFKKVHIVFIFLVVVSFLAAAIIIRRQILYHSPMLNKKAKLESLLEKPVITGFQLIGYDKGDKLFVVSAKEMYLRNRKIKPFGFRLAINKSAELEGVEVIFYKNNEQVSCLYSKSAIIDIKNKDILFNGKPFLITKDKKTLSAEKISWDNTQRALIAEGRCILGMDGKNQSASFVQADTGLNNFSIGK